MMGEESTNLDLEQLTEQMAEQIIFSIGTGQDDPKPAIKRLLRWYQAAAQEQQYNDALRGQQLEEHDQQS